MAPKEEITKNSLSDSNHLTRNRMPDNTDWKLSREVKKVNKIRLSIEKLFKSPGMEGIYPILLHSFGMTNG